MALSSGMLNGDVALTVHRTFPAGPSTRTLSTLMTTSMTDNTQPDDPQWQPSEGEIKSTSETVQMVMVGSTIIAGGGIFVSQYLLGWTPLAFGIIAAIVLAFCGFIWWITHSNYTSTGSIHPEGLRFEIGGKVTYVPFEKIESVSCHQQHHFARTHGAKIYVGSRLTLELCVEGSFRALRYDAEFHTSRPSYGVVEMMCKLCLVAVEANLRRKLETVGEIPWSSALTMTLDGFKCIAPDGSSSFVDFDQIDQWKVRDETLVVWKQGDVTPFISLSTRTPNLQALYSLARSLWLTYRQADAGAAEQEDTVMQELVTA